VGIQHCVIPAAGLGTRFLPATKALPKELLPVLDRPVLQWGVEEAVAAGLDTMVVVLSRGKELLGLGHAVLQARPVVGDRAFACLLPDDLSWAERPILAQLVDAHREVGTPMLALMRVPRDRISRYGSVAIAETRGRLHRVTAMVEKPAPDEAPSDLAIMGRYVLTPSVFDALASTPPGVGGEIQLTDGIAGALADGPIWGLEFEGELLDVGTPEGWLQALLRTAPSHPTFGPALREALERGLQERMLP
jgi:UTP--glucose-1-phosphate uridylyltransferase